MNRRFLTAILCSALTLSFSVPVNGQQADPATTDAATGPADDFAFEQDATSRMTVPISIDGKGPYRFLVDTGAERTVISDDLARKLNLGAGRTTRMHSISGVGNVDTVIIPSLTVSTRVIKDINAPSLERRHLGAEGMLGVDTLQSQRVLFDFAHQTMSISPARVDTEKWDAGTIVIKARSRFGRLILADARADGQRVWVIIDTGSQVTIGNSALRRKLASRNRLGPTTPLEITSVTGGTVMADYTKIKGLVMGGVTMSEMPIAFADVHPFKKLGLTDRPAILLGMDSLRVFDKVSVDFTNRKVRFVMPGTSGRNNATRMASLAL